MPATVETRATFSFFSLSFRPAFVEIIQPCLSRSITDDSAVFTDESGMHSLTTKKSRTIEDSILKGYVKNSREVSLH